MIHRREASGFEKEIRGEDPGNTLRLASHRSMACLTDACKVPRWWPVANLQGSPVRDWNVLVTDSAPPSVAADGGVFIAQIEW